MCSYDASCLCKPSTNNLAGSANHRIKSWFHSKKCTPTSVIEGLKNITMLQLLDIENMFSDQFTQNSIQSSSKKVFCYFISIFKFSFYHY